ncbi:DUF485 domain-containing protein [Pseudonocardia acaciae]|uniref:DUF485 domain-containing protein n=1 Tax=Pseudonocardia acaciae TaxID=551276 RepID=UPI0007E8D806|nr:DUF485 domain-containing protein [Pseudonocardia acaciae]
MATEKRPVPDAIAYQQVYKSAAFLQLKRRRRRFVLPFGMLFITWYAAYVGLAYYTPGFMAFRLLGNITVALVAGILQILSTLALATFYVRYANQVIDPEAANVRRMVEQVQRGDDDEPEFFHSVGSR